MPILVSNSQLHDFRHPPVAGCAALEADKDQGVKEDNTTKLSSDAWEPLDPVCNRGELRSVVMFLDPARSKR